ncbi:MAG TPA: S46 family peptidase [Gemmatimonadales bacterium]|nr:S46 family peptidase [Gemmatimonadales bacterium]
MARLLASLLLACCAATARAQVAAPAAPATLPASYVEAFGTMWTFDAPPLDYWKARYGFTPDAAWLDHVRLASVRLPNCSASFVSADGLVMTNHHCARACITAVSPPDTNYQRAGFVARSMSDEKKCAGLYVDQLRSIEDVTSRVRSRITGRAAAARVAQRDSAIAEIQDACQRETGETCQVVSFYQGGRYSLYRYRRYPDLRLVMAPEEPIAFFGGDPDNFTYPRYDLDLTLLRVYENDAPHRPGDYLRWSAAGASDGDLVFVIGNPGSTGRLLTYAQLEYLRDVEYPGQLASLARTIAVLEAYAGTDEQRRRQYENQLFYAQNSHKAISGYRRGLLDSTLMATKHAFERDFRRRIQRAPKLRARYAGAWDAIAGARAEQRRFATRARWYGFGGSQLLAFAGVLVRLPQEAALPDSLRLPAYRGQGLETLRAQVLREVPVDKELEKLTLAAHLDAMRKELPATDPLLTALLGGRSPEVAAEALIEGTTLGDVAVRRRLAEGGAAVRASDDAMVVLARRLAPISRAVAARNARLEAVVSANAERIGEAIFAAYGSALPPDATFTLRVSDGLVRGYPYNGTVAPYRTSFYGLYARSAEFDDTAPWQLPDRWKAARERLDLATPLDFVTTNDIIGGNSGSPMISRDGEVVGLVFDGNIEQLPNRFVFTDAVARSVGVHSRAITTALRQVYDAAWIADELEGRPAAAR